MPRKCSLASTYVAWHVCSSPYPTNKNFKQKKMKNYPYKSQNIFILHKGIETASQYQVQLQVKGEEKRVKYKLLFTVKASSGPCFFRLSCPHQAINYLQLRERSTSFYNWSHKVNRGVFKVRFQLQLLNSMINSWSTNVCSQTPKIHDEFLSKKISAIC